MKKKCQVMGVFLLIGVTLFGAGRPDFPERFEFYDEALRLFSCVPEGGDITADKETRGQFGYGRGTEPLRFVRDYTDKAANDFSVRFDAPGADDARLIGFTPGPWIDDWKVNENTVLHLYLKATPGIAPVQLALLDQAGRRAFHELSAFRADETWQAVRVPLKDFRPEQGFDFSGGVVGCEVHTTLPKGARIWFDDIFFARAGSDGVLGVTEKPVAQRISEARQTLNVRQQGLSPELPTDVFGMNAMLIAKGENLDEANRMLTQYFQGEEGRKAFGSGFHFGRYDLLALAFNYGSHGRLAAGHLFPETEKALLQVVWDVVKENDDIANARNSTWWLIGSENHDINHKVKCLLTSQLLSRAPDFAGKIYVDAGTGSGYSDHLPHLQGEGQWADGREYTPIDHYQAWVRFFREFLRERAKKGLFVEIRSNHYISAQITCVSLLHTYCDDEEIRNLSGMLLDVIWADYVQDSMSGINGGAKTRSSIRTRMSDLIIPLLGGPGAGDLTYQLPPVLWKLALKREILGEYAYLSRRPGEEEDLWPRPGGAERTQMCGAESRFLRYSWVTPDYVLGTQMDHPAAVQSHPSIVSRWNGVTFSSSVSTPGRNRSGVYPYLLAKPEYGSQNRYISGQHYKDFMYISLQHRNVLITQQPKPMRVRHVSPQWFPTDHAPWIGKDIAVFMEDADEVMDRQGWAFVRKGNAYVAVRPVMIDDKAPADGPFLPVREDSYTWSDDRKAMHLKDPYSPIIMDTGRKTTHGTFARFQESVLSNPLRVRPLIAGAYDLIYRGTGPEAKELVFNTDSNALPTVGGEPVDHSHPNVYESPHLFSKYNSGIVTIRRGDETLTLDFNPKE